MLMMKRQIKNTLMIIFQKAILNHLILQKISFVFPQFTSFHSVFHSFHGLMNSINWPASSIWVFIAQLGEHCSANAEATGSNPVEAPKNFFSGYFRNCLNCDSRRWSHTHFNFINIITRNFGASRKLSNISRSLMKVSPYLEFCW